MIIMRAFESPYSPYLTDTWDSKAGNGAEVIYSSQPWIYLKRTATPEDDQYLLKLAQIITKAIKPLKHTTS